MIRLSRRFIVTAIICLLFGAGLASAREIQQGDQCVVEAGDTVAGNLLVLCRSLTIDGHVAGDVIGVATTAVINGTVDEDVYLITGQLDVHGTVGKDIHFAGGALRIHEDARLTDDHADIMSASLSTALFPRTELSGSVMNVGYQLLLQGTVGNEVNFWGSSLFISGEVQNNVYAQVGDINGDVSQLETLLIPFPLDINLVQPGLRVSENARIEGLLRYSGPTEGEIPPGALAQEAIYTPVIVQPDFTVLGGQENATLGLALYLSQVIREFLTLAIIGALALLLMPRTIQAPLRNIQSRPLVCTGIGLLTFIMSFVVIPFVFLLTMLVIIIVSLLQINELTISVGAFLTVFDIGAASLIFFIVLFISRVVFALWLGRGLVRLVFREDNSTRRGYVALLLGCAIVAFFVSLPVIGWIINALALFLGLGAILSMVQARAETVRDIAATPRRYIAVTTPQLPRRADDSRMVVPPPPRLDATQRPLGMDNLPDGFSWWDDEG